MKISQVFLCLVLLLFVFLLPLRAVAGAGGLGEKERIRLIKVLSPSVVGVNSSVIRADDIASPVTDKGSGSGFVVDAAGYVVTLSKVISDRHAIEVVLWDGTTWPAIFRGEDEETSIAVLEIQAPDKVIRSLRPVKFSRSAVAGQDVLALGRVQGGEMLMASESMVSCAPRTLLTTGGSLLYDVVQTDSRFARVMDGGPMFDSRGRVIGMTAGSLVKSGDRLSGFGIPAATVQWVASCIIEKGAVERAWFGAGLVSVTPSLARFLGLPVTYGALITEIVPGGPADKAGLRGSEKTLCLGNRVYPVGGDIIVGLGKSRIQSDADVIRKLKQFSPGDTTLVTVYRGSRQMKLKIKLGRKR